MGKRFATVKRASRTPKPNGQARPVAGTGNLPPSRLSDWEKLRLLARMAGESVRELNLEVKAKDRHDAKIDQWLSTRRRHRCLVRLELFSSVELDCQGCGSRKGKSRLLQRALKRLCKEHGVVADLRRDRVHCTVFHGNRLVFAIESVWPPIDGKPEDAITVQRFELPPEGQSRRRVKRRDSQSRPKR